VCVSRLFGGGGSLPGVNEQGGCGSPPAAAARCTACDEPFSSSDLVVRVHHLCVFHSSCFSCCVCRSRLSRGQQFALVDTGRIYCRADYESRCAGSGVAGAPPHDADCKELVAQCRDDVRAAATSNHDDELSPSSLTTRHCRRRSTSWRTGELASSSLHQNAGQTNARFPSDATQCPRVQFSRK